MSDTITREELTTAIAAGEVTVVEALGPAYFAAGHLPGAVNIPDDEIDALAPVLLPDRHAPVVTYCSNTACRNSAIARARLRALGYTDVRAYEGAKQDWQEAGLPLETTDAALAR